MPEPVLIQIITTGGLIVIAIVQVIASKRQKRIEDDVRVTRSHTENKHQNDEYPNLRDEVTAIRRTVERGFEQTHRYVKDVDVDQKATRDALDRHILTAERIVEDAKRDVDEHMAALVAEGMRAHTSDCAMRSQSAIISITNP